MIKSISEVLSDSSKQDRIEIKLIKRLHQIDTNEAFNKIFLKVLSLCEKTRNQETYQTRRIPISEANENNPLFLSILANNCCGICYKIIQNLYSSDPQIRKKCLNSIRILNDMENEFGDKYKRFFTFLNRIFTHSRHLLTLTMAPQVIEKYGITGINEGELMYRVVSLPITKMEEEKEEKKEEDLYNCYNSSFVFVHICEFQKDGTNYACLFREKKAGVHFGALIEIGITNKEGEMGLPVIEDDNKKIYFLKAYHGYPAIKEKNSHDAYSDSKKSISSVECYSQAIKSQELNIVEPFIYKLLENLKVGPSVHFMINPYLNNGFYIVTEDLNADGFYFVDLRSEEIKADFEFILAGHKELNLLQHNMFTDFVEMNLLTNILSLGDIKQDNLGFIFPQDNEEGQFNPNKVQIKIIDFLDESNAQSDVINSFMYDNMFVDSGAKNVYSQFFQDVSNIYRKVQNLRVLLKKNRNPTSKKVEKSFPIIISPNQKLVVSNSITDLCEQFPAAVKKRIEQAKETFPKLEKRGVDGNFVKAIEKTEKDFRAFFDSSSSFGKRNIEIVFPITFNIQYVKLREYCNSVYERFNKLRNFISGEYVDWQQQQTDQFRIGVI